jgi:hypothetical protein
MHRTKFSTFSIVLIFNTILFLSVARGNEREQYLDYGLFQELTALAPELANVRLAVLTEEGQRLWSEGQMQIPKGGAVMEGDLNQNGIPDASLLIAAKDGYYLLLADRSQERAWQKPELRRFATEKELELYVKYRLLANQWDGKFGRDKENVNLLEYIVRDNGPYDLFIMRQTQDPHWQLKVKIQQGGTDLYTWEASPESAYQISQGVIYHTDFSPIASGMTLRAYDLQNKKELWKTELTGMGPIAHSRYWNYGCHLSFTEDNLIEVVGKEAAGRYIEYVDPTTGKTLVNRSIRDW